MKIAGLDVGTTGCKITVFDDAGKQLTRKYCDYPAKRTVAAHEIDASAILAGVLSVIRAAAQDHPDIAGIGVTSFGETCVLTDEHGTPLRPAMLYTDPRGVCECEELVERLGDSIIARISGIKPHEMYSLPKIMWVKKHEPEIYAKVRRIFLIADFVVFHLTGRRAIDYSLASRTMGLDIRKLQWSRTIFDAAGVDLSFMSETVPAGTVAGTLTADVGLSRDTKIVCVGHDQVAAAVGAGVFDSDTAVDGAGTVECITPVYDSIPDMDVMTGGNFALVPYVIPGKYVCYAFSYTGGALIQWCVDTIAKAEKQEAEELGISVNELLESRSVRPTGLLVLPHFAGAATPYMDTGSRGAIVGMTMATTTADIYCGCMEGVVYEMLLNMEYLKPSGVHFGKLNATGGGARSRVWMQMKADILGIPITALETADAGTVGSAMLTGLAIGCFDSLEAAAEIMVHELESFYPRAEMHAAYQRIYARYHRLYEAVRPLMPDAGGKKSARKFD